MPTQGRYYTRKSNWRVDQAESSFTRRVPEESFWTMVLSIAYPAIITGSKPATGLPGSVRTLNVRHWRKAARNCSPSSGRSRYGSDGSRPATMSSARASTGPSAFGWLKT